MFYDYFKNGTPLIKPLVYFDQEDPQTHYRSDEFVFGNQILVCPIQEPNVNGRRIYLPKGDWYNMWSDAQMAGGRELWVDAPIDQMPLFIKAGSIIPKYPIQQYVGEKQIDDLKLDVYFKEGTEKSMIFEDSNDGYDYTKGKYLLRSIKLIGNEKELHLQQHMEGKYTSKHHTYTMKFVGLPFEPKSINLDGKKSKLTDLDWNPSTKSLKIHSDFSWMQLK